MEDEQGGSSDEFEKVYEKIIDEKCGGDYRPNPIETYQVFKERKKAALEQGSSDMVDKALEGIMLFVAVDGDNERTADLMNKFFAVESIPALQGGSLEALAKTMGEQNVFGLLEEDYVRLMGLADRVTAKGQFEVSIRMYQALIFLFPGMLEPWLKWANVEYEHFFDYKKVLGIYERCVEAYDHPAVYSSMGICHVKGKEFGLAEECFTKALELCDKYDDNELKEMTAAMLADLKNIKSL